MDQLAAADSWRADSPLLYVAQRRWLLDHGEIGDSEQTFRVAAVSHGDLLLPPKIAKTDGHIQVLACRPHICECRSLKPVFDQVICRCGTVSQVRWCVTILVCRGQLYYSFGSIHSINICMDDRPQYGRLTIIPRPDIYPTRYYRNSNSHLRFALWDQKLDPQGSRSFCAAEWWRDVRLIVSLSFTPVAFIEELMNSVQIASSYSSIESHGTCPLDW